jgi:hypothetical protein
MTTQERRAQIAWQQFSHQLRTADDRPTLDYYYRIQREEYDESFDFPAPDPRHIHTTENTRTSSTKKQIQTKQKMEEIQPNTASSTHPQVKKARTRSQRRAIEEITEQEPEIQASKHKERRSSYWVERDDKRRSEARTFKVQFQNQ